MQATQHSVVKSINGTVFGEQCETSYPDLKRVPLEQVYF